jgi:hypothetical protein
MHRFCTRCGVIVPANEYRAHVASHRPGSTYAWRKLREGVLDRDGHRCRVCGATELLEVHHLDGDWRNDALSNLETRCRAHNPRGGQGATHGPYAA